MTLTTTYHAFFSVQGQTEIVEKWWRESLHCQLYFQSIIKRQTDSAASTTSGQTNGQTSNTDGQTNGQTITTSGQTNTTNG